MDRAAVNFTDPVRISALKKEGLSGLIEKIMPYVDVDMAEAEFLVPAADAKLLSIIRASGVVKALEYEGELVRVKVEMSKKMIGIINKRLGPSALYS